MKPFRLTGLWRNPDFMKLWASQTVSEFGSRITRDALPLVAVITLQATPDQMGWLTALTSLPILLFGLYAGVLVDRVRRLPVLIAANLLRPLLLLAVPLAALTGTLRMEYLYIIAALTGLLGLVFEIAYRAVLPALIPREDLLEGNSKLATTDSLAEIGGPAIAGLLVQWITAPLAILFDIASYLAGAVLLLMIRQREPAPQPAQPDQTAIRDIRAGWSFLLAHPLLRPLLLHAALSGLLGSLIGPLYSLYGIRTLGLTPAQLGLTIAAGGIGALAGALLTGWLARRMPAGYVLIGSRLVAALVLFLLPLAGGPPLAAMLMLIVMQIVSDAAMTIFSINELSLRQMATPDAMLGRVSASVGFITEALTPLGAIAGGLLASATSPRTVLMIAALGGLMAALVLVVSPLRQVQRFSPGMETVG